MVSNLCTLLIFVCSFFFSGSIFSQDEIAQEDAGVMDGINCKSFVFSNGGIIVGAGHDNAKAFAVTSITHNPKKQMIGSQPFTNVSYASQKIILDRMKNVPNPFYGSRIAVVGVLDNKPVVIPAATPNKIFLMESAVMLMEGHGPESEDPAIANQEAEKNRREERDKKEAEEAAKSEEAKKAYEARKRIAQRYISSVPLCDAQGDESAGIIATASGSGSKYLFAAVKSNAGVFGDDASGIALVEHDHHIIKEKKENKDTKKIEEVVVDDYYTIALHDAAQGIKDGNKAIALTALPFAAQADWYTIAPNAVAMHYDHLLQRLYIGVQLKTNCATQGVSAVVVGRVVNKKLEFEPIAPHKIITNNSIVGASGNQQEVSIHKIKTLHAKGLSYLVVVGGNGSPCATNDKVYALPLVDNSFETTSTLNSQSHGLLASADVAPKDYFTTRTSKPKFQTRRFQDVSDEMSDIYNSHDAQVIVGAGKQLPNAITDVHVCEETVYVCVKEKGHGQLPGIFYSQPIYEPAGNIIAWTPWKRAFGVTEPVVGVTVNNVNGSCWYILEYDGRIQPGFTAWPPVRKDPTTGKKIEPNFFSMDELVTHLFAREDGGVHALFDFPRETPGLAGKDAISFLLATGYQKIAMIETGWINADGYYGAHNKDYYNNCLYSFDGTIGGLRSQAECDDACPRTLVIQGGALQTLGPICAATIATDGKQSWLCVAGPLGVAVLADESGCGWNNHQGLGHNFARLSGALAFKKIGYFSLVNKLMTDGSWLYVLTDDELQRIELSPNAIKNNNITPVTIAAKNKTTGGFMDAGVSGSCAVLATTRGLFTTSNAQAPDCTWRQIPLGKDAQTVHSLFFVSPTEFESDFAKNGQVYAIAGSLVGEQTQVYRLFAGLGKDEDNAVRPMVHLMPDQFYKDESSAFINAGSFKRHFYTDGAHYYFAEPGKGDRKPVLELLSSGLGFGERKSVKGSVVVPLYLKGKVKTIGSIVRNSATGNVIVSGDFGLRTNEYI